jgi:hypothetical protein
MAKLTLTSMMPKGSGVPKGNIGTIDTDQPTRGKASKPHRSQAKGASRVPESLPNFGKKK